jgi:outer membrane protein OmpA-like peptidoglycan-associated protein
VTRSLTVLLPLLAAGAAVAATPPPQARNFVACPIVQDTATVPCWIAKSGGETYYLGIQSDIGGEWYPPQLNHQVLVEGTVSKEPRICGGVVLKPIKTSVLPEVDKSCNTILPAKASMKVHAERGPGPSGIKPADPSQPAKPPERRPPQPAAAPQPPFQARNFDVPFDFDGEYMFIRTSAVVGQAMRYAEATKAKKVEVVGYRGSVLLSDGNPFVERADMAERRAKKVARALRDIGVSPSITTVTWKSEPEPPDGVEDWKSRRVVIRVEP